MSTATEPIKAETNMQQKNIPPDETDRKLLNLMQEDFPLTLAPFKDLAETLGITEDSVLDRIRRLKDADYIRRIGAVLDTETLSFVSCVCAVAVPPERLEEVTEEINLCMSVTHNYQRDDELNLWFTITTKNQKIMDRILSKWERKLKITIYRFPGLKTYKRKVQFLVGKEDPS